MRKTGEKVLSLYLSFLIIISMMVPAFIVSYGAENSINITDENGVEITERQTIKEYDTVYSNQINIVAGQEVKQ